MIQGAKGNEITSVSRRWRNPLMRQRSATATGVLIACACCVLLPAESATPPTTREVAASVAQGTVSIRAQGEGDVLSAGSGFIADAAGTIVTNYHVVEGATRIEVRLPNGDLFEVAGVRAVDRRRDIAVLQIPGFNLPTVRLGDSDRVAPGDAVIVIGNALGLLDNTITTGVVSAIRAVDGNRLFQMDAATSPGNSGGPVANDSGEVIAVTVAKVRGGENLNFSIPINFVRGYLQQQPQLGLALLKTPDAESLFAENKAPLPRRWRSLLTGTTKTVRISGDVMFVETELASDLSAAGAKNFSELRKQGDGWIGTNRSNMPCTYVSIWDLTNKVNWCPLEAPTGITLLSSEKIEGWAMAPPPSAKFNCARCTYNKPLERTTFTWIPD